jgi:hypothetical protein
MLKTSSWFTLIVSVLISATIWFLTPLLTHHREPWDADGSFYLVAILLAGTVAGTIAPKPLWAHYAGSFIGQLAYELLFLRIGPLVIVGAFFLLGFCALYSVAAGLAGLIHRHIKKRFTSQTVQPMDLDTKSNS